MAFAAPRSAHQELARETGLVERERRCNAASSDTPKIASMILRGSGAKLKVSGVLSAANAETVSAVRTVSSA